MYSRTNFFKKAYKFLDREVVLVKKGDKFVRKVTKEFLKTEKADIIIADGINYNDYKLCKEY